MKEQLLKIAELCIRINEETEHAAFYGFSGHVNCLSVDIRKSKKEYDVELFSAQLINANDAKRLEKVINGLEVFLKGYELIPTRKKVIPEKVIQEYVKVVI